MWDYSPFLPKFKERITLVEGNTPLLPVKNIKTLQNLLLKLESRNPTGTFRDRASSLILSDAISQGASEIICASTGSFSISIAAYAAKAQLASTNILPQNIELSKIEQIKIYGSQVIQAGKTLDDALYQAQIHTRHVAAYSPSPSYNILTIEGQKTIGLELAQQFPDIQDLVIPMGSGSLLIGVYRGFLDAVESGWVAAVPRIHSVSLQDTAQAHLAESLEMNSGLLTKEVGQIVEKTHGVQLEIDASEMINDALEIAKMEGIFIEPASASVISAIKHLINDGKMELSTTAAILSGTGLNAMNIFASQMREMKKVVWGLSDISTRRFEILRLIAEDKAAHGYAIWLSLGKNKSLQSIYQHLINLENDGLIINVGGEEKRARYEITPKGLEMFEKMKDLIDLTTP